MGLRAEDRAVLRALAEKYMAFALSDENDENRRLWRSLNDGHMQKPMVAIDQMPWNELNPDGSLSCTVEDPYFRRIEWTLRSEIYKWERLRADMVLNPYVLLPRLISNTGYGLRPEYELPDGARGFVSKRYVNQFKGPEDAEKIKTPVITVDREGEARVAAEAADVFDGIAPVRMQGIVLHLGFWDWIAQWMGVENCYIELMDRPEMMHAIMERLTEATLDEIDQINALGLYDVNCNMCHCSYTFSDSLPSDGCDHENPTSRDGWAFGMAQLFTSVSPQITEEFEVRYMDRIFPRFGAIYYGCCDRLDDRLDVICRLPNIKKISCSPWSDRENFAANLPDRYIMSNKPSPSFLAQPSFDEDAVRADLRRTIAAAKKHGLRLELLLKDISTVNNEPQRLTRWAQIAKEETLSAAL
ncbi:MAG: hypothetical protein J5879_00460 [Clostridia bacterium]|nr:hypothetical protein [Clostridia bacterium]